MKLFKLNKKDVKEICELFQRADMVEISAYWDGEIYEKQTGKTYTYYDMYLDGKKYQLTKKLRDYLLNKGVL